MTGRDISAAALASLLPDGGRVLVSSASGESVLLAEKLIAAGEALPKLSFTGIFVPSLNQHSYLVNAQSRVETFFLTPELRAQADRVTYLPLCYADILARLRNVPIAAALIMVAPPDKDGFCSLGCSVDFLAELWPHIPILIAHINPSMPRTAGHRGIPLGKFSAIIEADSPLLGMADAQPDAASLAIGRHVAPFIRDGATLQTGLGKVPSAILRALTSHRNLRIHSGLIGDAVVDLKASGALAPGVSVTAGVAIGSPRLYEAITGPAFSFQSVSVTHDPATIAAIPNFVAINSAIEVDLFGQAYAELGPAGLMSGPGGASDYARAARTGGGLRIVALTSTAARGAISRIVAPGATVGPVSLGRMDIDIIVTELGAADLRGLGHGARAAALIGIADPVHREALAAGWRTIEKKF